MVVAEFDPETAAYVIAAFFAIFALMGLFILLYTVRKIHTQSYKKTIYTKDSATVVERKEKVSKSRKMRGMLLYQPVFEYSVKDKQYRLSGYSPGSNDWSSLAPKIGEKRVIWINPNDPCEAFIEEPVAEVVVVIIVGLVFFVLGGLIFFSASSF